MKELLTIEQPDRGIQNIHAPIKLDRQRLNIADRMRTSRLPWKGQFSPELVAYLLDSLCPEAQNVLDPFCGSGTVLFEAARHRACGIGIEINPAAWHLASLATLSSMGSAELERLSARIDSLLRASESMPLFDDTESGVPHPKDIISIINKITDDYNLHLCLSVAALLAMGDSSEISSEKFNPGLISVKKLLWEIASYSGTAHCYLADARSTPLPDNSIDAVITSPPYINVFNYHQNYRAAMELFGWNPLGSARSEIGANRKHRQNRFLTVIQYCLDMTEVFNELSRVTKKNAPIIFVVGRESNVLGTPIKNSALLKEILDLSEAFELRTIDERYFTNRYGKRIYEDIIVATKVKQADIPLSMPRLVSKKAIEAVFALVPDKNRDFLSAAHERIEEVSPSPLFHINEKKALPHSMEGIFHVH